MKTVIILFNLGGPDSLDAVQPFLFNLFSDKAIIRLPNPFRFFIAKRIAARRTQEAKHTYEQIGGKSPILEQTQAQAKALEESLNENGEINYKTFVCMRYWHPRSDEVTKSVKDYAPDRIILLPLYPQYSTTTTASSFADWRRAAKQADLTAPTQAICCYPTDISFIATHAQLLRDAYFQAAGHGKPRVIFSAHGLPEKIINSGDPYQWQVEQTVAAVVKLLAIDHLDHIISYQSRVGRLKWLEPSTEATALGAARSGLPIVIVPIAFVSEHSETLVELDIDIRTLAEKSGSPHVARIPALGVEKLFIEALKNLCLSVSDQPIASSQGSRLCPNSFSGCPCS